MKKITKRIYNNKNHNLNSKLIKMVSTKNTWEKKTDTNTQQQQQQKQQKQLLKEISNL